jgi:hypothetical protein
LLDRAAFAVTAQPQHLFFSALPVICAFLLEIVKKAQQSLCLQRAGAPIGDHAQNLQVIDAKINSL